MEHISSAFLLVAGFVVVLFFFFARQIWRGKQYDGGTVVYRCASCGEEFTPDAHTKDGRCNICTARATLGHD